MNNSIFKDLSFKVFRSGNPIYFYIGINTILFIVPILIAVFCKIAGIGINVEDLITEYLALPGNIGSLPERFYTIITYMFLHDGFLHFLFNMLGLFWFGSVFMNFLKAKQFHFVYIAGGVVGGLFFLAAFNLIPYFASNANNAFLVGASAAVVAIIFATATLVPNYSFMLLFFGEVKIKYIAIIYFVLDLIGLGSFNAGGSLAHIGGALLGFAYIKSLQNGNDWSKILERKPKLKVVKNNGPIKKSEQKKGVSQQEIDAILDKISSSGYDKLSASEKEKLFKASKD